MNSKLRIPLCWKAFFVDLSNPINASLAAVHTRGTGTILDNDFPHLSVSDATVIEPLGFASTNAVFLLQLTTPLPRTATVDYTTQDGSAQVPGDYSSVSGQLTLTPGTLQTNLAVEVFSDALSESDETFFLILSNPVGILLDRSQGRGTIIDNSPTSLPQIAMSGTAVVEGRSGVKTNAVFKLALSRPSALPVQVDFATGNGTAFGGTDFVITSGTATFAPGETNAFISVIVNGDDLPEVDESFLVRLTNPINAALAATQAEGKIINDDYLAQVIPSGTQLLLENCQPSNQAIDPLETVTVNFALQNRGVGATTNLVATLLAHNQVIPISNPQTYGVLPANGTAASRPFTFMIDGACGQKIVAELELRDSTYLVGTIPFEFTLGALSNGRYVCCSSADLGVTARSEPDPVGLASPLTYVITITNRGPSVATEVVLTNRWSTPVQFLPAPLTALVCTNSEDQSVCALGDLPPGQSLSVTNVIAPTTLGDLFDYVLVAARENDPVSADNLAVVHTSVEPPSGLSINDITVPEGDRDHTEQFVVRLWPSRAQPVTVEFNLSDGTAHAGRDYAAGSGQLTFSPGETSQNLEVVILGNTTGEPTRTFFANLANPVNAQIARGQGLATILDDDPPAISINDVAVNVGTNAATVAVLTVSLASASKTPVLVNYATTNGTANAGTDYEPQRGTLTFPPGTRALTISIPIAGNTSDEGVESFYVQLSDAQNGSLVRDRGVVTIEDEAPADLSVSNVSVAEGNGGQSSATFTITLRHPIQNTVTVDFYTSDGTALAGSDYLPKNGTLAFAPGTTENTVSVIVMGDLLSEPDETFFLNLTNSFNGVIRNDRGVGTILNDDAVPCLSIGDLSVLEGNAGTNSALMPLRLSGPSSASVTVDAVIPSCRSTSPNQSFRQSIVFAPGQLEASVIVPVVGNSVREADETCFVQLVNAVNATVCRDQGTLTIIDDDPLPGLAISDVSVFEGNNGPVTATFAVSLAGLTSQTVSVQFSTADGTAISPSDYVALSGLLTFAPGQTSTNISIQVNGDATIEPDEIFFVNLSQPINASLFRAQATGTILNDDSAPQLDCPALVALATPGEQTCFQPFSPITLTAIPDVGADQIDRMEFYSGASLIGLDTSSPFEIVWEGAPVGDYCITAKAICKSGRSVSSDPTCIGVTDSGAAIAIVRNFDDPEIGHLRDYLLEMGYCARVFDQAGLTADALSSFQLVIWDDLGRDGLSDATVQIFQQLFDNNIPLYFIGDRLTAALAQLSPANQPVWSSLLHLQPLGRTGAPGSIAFSTLSRDREPGSILTGRFAAITDFTYTNTVVLAQATPGSTSLATALAADLFVEYPDADTTDVGQARLVSQGFRVLTGGDLESVTDRKALFQNAICWLLRCSFCDLVNVSVASPDFPASVNVGDEFTFNLLVSNNGECTASATVLTNHLPAGLTVVNLSYNQGTTAEYNAAERTIFWRIGSVVSGTENNAVLTVTARAVQAGLFQGDACGTANYQRPRESNCIDLEVNIQGTSLPSAPKLNLLQTGSGLYQLRLTGDQGVVYRLQNSTDLAHWLSWTNAPGPLFFIGLPDPAIPGAKSKFYRAQWP